MQELNAAADAALAALGEPARSPERSSPPSAPDTSHLGTRDHPSFTIEALPVEAFEALVLAGSVLGQLGDDEPPYRLDVLLGEPFATWCRLDVVPDGGGSTVSLAVGPGAGVLDVRDAFVAEINQLDWGTDGPRLPPS